LSKNSHTMRINSWVSLAGVSIIFWLLPVDALNDDEEGEKFWSDWKKISEISPRLQAKLQRRGRQYENLLNTEIEDDENITAKEEGTSTIEYTGIEVQEPQDSIKSNQLYAAAFLLENYLKLIPDQSILENIICRQVQRRQAPRGIWDMLDFYSVLGDFWDKYGAHYGELNWVKMYDVYSDNAKFKNMFKKKQKQVNIIWKGQGLPTKNQMKDIINHLTNHPEKKTQIAAVVEILREFTSSTGRNRVSSSSLPHIRSALVIATAAMEDNNPACKVVEDVSEVGEEVDDEHKDKTFGDTELLLDIGKAIVCVLCGVVTPGLCDVACKIAL